MNLAEINNHIETVETSVTRRSGDDDKYMMGLLALGVWEVARQLAQVNFNASVGAKRDI